MVTSNFKAVRVAGLLFALSLVAFCCRLSPAPSQTKPASPTVTLVAVGDILLDRGVGKKIEKFGTDYPFKHVAGVLRGADIAFGNLECPLSKNGTKVVKPFVFKARPEYSEALIKGGFDMLSLANNHTLDCGREGLVETQQHLKARGVLWCGAGVNHAAAQLPTIMEVRGIKIAFVGFCDFLPEGTFWREDRPTIALATEERVQKAVQAARKRADVVIASFHWGIEYSTRPSERQLKLAKAAISAGADLVLGHHPHVLQGLEVVKPKNQKRSSLVAYSLGNFVFDSPRKWTKATADSMMLRCTLSKAGIVSAEVLPVKIEEFRPRPASAAEAKTMHERLKQLSGELKSRVENGRVGLLSEVR